MKPILVSLLLCMFYCSVSAAPDKIVCYFASWSSYREGNGKFTIEDIDPFKCTHIIYSFVGTGTDGSVKILDPHIDVTQGGFKRFNDLKKKNPNLKTLVAMGGWQEGSDSFSPVANDANLRSNLATNVINFMNQYGFDGFDLDWEHPGTRGGKPYDKSNFLALVRTCREKFDATGRKYLLTAAVATGTYYADTSYDVAALSNYLDFINVMTYDFHGQDDEVTGQNGPLYPAPWERDTDDKERNVEAGVRSWLQRGAPAHKLVLGLGVYGLSFTLANSNNHNLGAPISGPGNNGPYTTSEGTLGYYEICELENQGGWTTVWDDVQKVPYIYRGDQWVGYDNPRSIKIKVEFAKSLNLGGLMIWSIGTDDFRGMCGPKWPILSAIREAMGGATVTPPTPVTPPHPTHVTPPPQTPVTPKPPSSGSICSATGGYYIRDPTNCSRFYYCENGRVHEFNCSPTLYYDTRIGNCNYDYLVQC